ncbi:MAG: class I tRNA ligase family protein [Clostridia bacterium]|nr:class I tRNA ligase family protein [Clostridia bacterium]
MYSKEIDEKWQRIWEDKKPFRAEDFSNKEKFYALIEFPYPSGVGLHVGHARAFMGMEAICRKKRLQGYNVLYPIGFDAFGLPTENYAMKTGIHPRKVTDDNIANFTKQLKSIGFSFDYDRVVDTTTPEYFKWTQWIFLKLFEKGLAYKEKTYVNYCPKCRVILANEESQGGKCDRCDSQVIQKEKEVWMLKITEYADKLLEGLNEVDFMPRVRIEQENWIGKSSGAQIKFNIKDTDRFIEVFTTRPDTIFGVTYMALAPEHPILDELKDKISNFDELVEYRNKANQKTEFERVELAKDKTGVLVKGIEVVHPITGELVPVWITDYVMMGYGTGSIMAVPAHDTRDYEFAKKFGINIKPVIAWDHLDVNNPPREGKQNTDRQAVVVLVKHWSEDKYICLKWKKQTWIDLITGGIEEGEDPILAAIREVKEETGYINIKSASYLPFEHIDRFFAAHKDVNRVVYQKNIVIELENGDCQETSQDEKDQYDILWLTKEEMLEQINIDSHTYFFEVYLKDGEPWLKDGILVNSGFLNGLDVENAKKVAIEYLEKNNIGVAKNNYHMKDWAFARQRYWGEPVPIVKCDDCGLVPLKENDLPLTLPDVDNFIPGEDGESPLAKIDSWVNTVCPCCGKPAKRETDTMPQWAGSSWYFLRYIDPKNSEALADKDKLKYWLSVDWYNGGMEHVTRHLIYSRFWHRFLYDIGVVPTKEPYAKRTTQGLILGPDGEKMSKSRGNVVNPDDIINEYGADTLRTYILFIGEYSQSAPWSDNGVKGAKKFLDRVMRLDAKAADEDIRSSMLDRELNMVIKKVTLDIEDMKYNTAIAAMMSYVNVLYKEEKVSKVYIKPLLQILNPIAPHVTEELWEKLGFEGHVFESVWPKYDESKLELDQIELAVQINGTVRFKLVVDSSLDEASIEQIVRNDERLKQYLVEKAIKKVIVIKSRIVNVVIG